MATGIKGFNIDCLNCGWNEVTINVDNDLEYITVKCSNCDNEVTLEQEEE